MHTEPYAAIRTNCVPKNYTYTVMFDRDVGESVSFHEEFCVMESASEGDTVDVCISSVGGSVATISKFQDVVKNSKAHFHGKLTGYGFSAAGALFLLCHTQEVADLATMMIHTAQSGTYGSAQGSEACAKMTQKQAITLINMVYKDFLTEEEISDVLKGMEFWMEADEIRERLARRDAIRDERERLLACEGYSIGDMAEDMLLDIKDSCSQMGYDFKEMLGLLHSGNGEEGFTKEQMSAMSKDEILAAIFGEDDSDVVSTLDDSTTDISIPDAPVADDVYLNMEAELRKLSPSLVEFDNYFAAYGETGSNIDLTGLVWVNDEESEGVSVEGLQLPQLRECATNFNIPYKPYQSAAFLRKQVQGFVDKVVAILNQK